ncbi:1367_t:CDS:2 [Acaulospora colombiana]|uniref:1367_t:CDS:1 n=1 Tax=Acaulospora colombiana TaxID=27376 RepID=A0ACA9K9B5_9GLOM|nr:1367_t:CDS:2 [Acaulospora colombiana]
MVRGYSLAEDLILLINNPQYGDLKINCEDGVLHGNRAILAARSDFFDRLLYNGMKESFEEQVSFPDVKISVMMFIFTYLYTGLVGEDTLSVDTAFDIFQAADYFQLDNLKGSILGYYEKICQEESNAPELLTKVIQHLSSSAENAIVDFLVKSVARIPLDTIEIGRLSFEALQYLLSKTCEENILISNGYSILRYAILLSAKEETPEAFSVLKKRLPKWKKIEHGMDIRCWMMPDISNARASIVNKLASLIEFIDLRNVDGNVLTDVIEPLDLITPANMMKAYRFHTRHRISYSRRDIKWDKNGCWPDISVSLDGRAISSKSKGYQSVRTNYLMSSGIHELCILIDKISYDEGIGLIDGSNGGRMGIGFAETAEAEDAQGVRKEEEVESKFEPEEYEAVMGELGTEVVTGVKFAGKVSKEEIEVSLSPYGHSPRN